MEEEAAQLLLSQGHSDLVPGQPGVRLFLLEWRISNDGGLQRED